MLTIHKINLEVKQVQRIVLPYEAEILTIQSQFDEPVLWAIVNTEVTVHEERIISMYETGKMLPEMSDKKYLSTIQSDGGNYVLHCFISNKRRLVP